MAAEIEQPRKRLIIKLCFPRSEATKMVDYSAKPIIKSYWVSRGNIIKKKKKSDHHHRETETTRSKKVVDAINVSRTVSSELVQQNDVVGFRGEIMKTMKVMSSTARNPENYSRRRVVGAKDRSSRTVDSSSVDDYSRPKKMMKVERPRSTITSNNFIKENKTTPSMKGAAVSMLSKTLNRKNDDVESKKEKKKKKKKKKKEIIMEMDRCKKMQSWAILKRMMIGKDGWALKQFSIDYLKKPLEEINLNNNNSDQCGDDEGTLLSKSITSTTKLMKPTKLGLEDIEGKLNKWLYSKPDEFADDLRLVFSRALMLYPPRTDIHRIATRLSDTFETTWKSLKQKWKLEARQQHI